MNLSAGTAGGKRKSARVRFNDAVITWQKDIAGASSIEFPLVNESALLDRLALLKHAGRRLFWFNQAYLGFEALERLYKERSQYAGLRELLLIARRNHSTTQGPTRSPAGPARVVVWLATAEAAPSPGRI